MVNKIKLSEIEELVELLDDAKNSEEGIDISKLFSNSSAVLNWKCANNHFFKEKLGVMYKRKNKCFFCTGRQIWPGENDLQTLFPEIAKEFDVEKNGITPDHISPKDTRTYYWTCTNNHRSYTRSVEHRITRNAGCPYCSGKLAISGENDLKTLFPEIANEWDYENNDGIMPEDVNPYAYTYYSWVCPKGHHYRKKAVERTRFHKPIDCPKCIKAKSTSFPEQAIYYYVKKCFPETVNRYREPFENGMELDVYIPSFRIGLEYDGMAFHKSEDQHERELKKYKICQNLGIKLVRIKEAEDTWKDTADDIFVVKKRVSDQDFSLFLHFMFSKIFMVNKYIFSPNNDWEAFCIRKYGFPTDFNISRDRSEILEYLVDIEHSFGLLYPDQAKLWDEDDNGKLTPYMFPPGSNYEPILKCPKCGNKWKSPISSIVSRKVQLCRNCSMSEMGRKLTKQKVVIKGSLAEQSDKLFKQWDFEENGDLSPYEIPLTYSKNVAWKCDKCGHKWSSSPVSRVKKDKISDCPHCTGRVAMPGVDDFQTLYPDLAKEWDYSLNKGVLPSQIKPFTNRKYYFICLKGHESYSSLPGNRINGSGCPICGRIEQAKKKSKKVGQFDEKRILINSFDSLHDAAKEMEVVPNAIFQAVKNKTKSKGFYWDYI